MQEQMKVNSSILERFEFRDIRQVHGHLVSVLSIPLE